MMGKACAWGAMINAYGVVARKAKERDHLESYT
jgi:hypothetical protein